MLNKKTLSEQIYQLLKQDILSQKIGFGEKLINRDLQKKYGVSSTPIRDAINRLYQDGLVEDITKNGARVIAFDLTAAIEINEIITILSVGAVKLSAEKSDVNKVVQSLERYITLQKENIDNEKYRYYDHQFHNTFCIFSDNSRYQHLFLQYDSLWELLVMFFYYDTEEDVTKLKSEKILQHQRILEAYHRGNITEAQYLMKQHYKEAENVLERVLG